MKKPWEQRRKKWLIIAGIFFVLGQLIPAVCNLIALSLR